MVLCFNALNGLILNLSKYIENMLTLMVIARWEELLPPQCKYAHEENECTQVVLENDVD